MKFQDVVAGDCVSAIVKSLLQVIFNIQRRRADTFFISFFFFIRLCLYLFMGNDKGEFQRSYIL
jgi:hypothetical protein